MAKPEDKLCFSVKLRLDYWKSQGIVIHYDDTRRLGLKATRFGYISHKNKGTPDIVAYFKYKDQCGILFIELKTPNDKISVAQVQFMMKFKDLTNVYYLVVKKPDDVEILLENLTGHIKNTLDNIRL